MTTPDAGDASFSPDHSSDQDGSEMADQSDQRAASDDPSTATVTTTTANTKNNNNTSSRTSAGTASTAATAAVTTAPKPSTKDPLRPRRKKARRACFACQRAHLTCGDERPCQRCIKRGLQDACHDGVRKKAKYLHDAPAEALVSGVSGHYTHLTHVGGHQAATVLPRNGQALSQPDNNYFPQPHPQHTNYNVYPNSSQAQMPPPIQEPTASMTSFNNQHSPISPQYTQSTAQQTSPVPSIVGMQTNPHANTPAMHDFGTMPFDPSDPTLFNFDLAGLNFGNHYGALEFGMLGHMSSGAAGTPPDTSSIINPLNQAASIYSGPMSATSGSSDTLDISSAGLGFPDGLPSVGWQTHSRQGSATLVQTPNNTPATSGMDHQLRQDGQNNMPIAYAVGAGPSSMAGTSPGSNIADGQTIEVGTPVQAPSIVTSQQQQEEQHRHQTYSTSQQLQTEGPPQQQRQQRQRQRQQQPLQRQETSHRPRRNPSEIYDSVTSPYSYTDGFHGLSALLKRRFSLAKRSRIAEAIASIRPSFIACTSTLNTDDLIFMEKSFQRTLYQYEDFINAHAVPTIICRRTGQIAAVSQEFSLLTGWKKDVLLGFVPNQNVNTGGSSAVGGGGGGSTGQSGGINPREVQPNVDNPRPVYLAELLDDNSVCQFYEDFAKLAFVAPRATATRSCKLIRYQTKDDLAVLENANIKSEESGRDEQNKSAGYAHGNTVVKLEGGAGAGRLGDKDGLINCMFCWSVKRDVFEVPMLIVMNFLPIME